MMKPTRQQMLAIVQQALSEDIGDGDITTTATVADKAMYNGQFIAKATGIFAGLEIAQMAFDLVALELGYQQPIDFMPLVWDGDTVEKGKLIAKVYGPGRVLLTAERTALNFMQRMSGIATLTNRYVDAIKGTNATILDTRKTVPCLRMLDKAAVAAGGGTNHRIGLFDRVLIKENHIAAAGGIQSAVEKVRSQDQRGRKIEVEVRNLDELGEALALHVDQIMLDNMNLAEMRQAVQLVDGAVPLEASGNVSLETVRDIAETGVDFISVGKLTHSVEAFDISFLLEKVK